MIKAVAAIGSAYGLLAALGLSLVRVTNSGEPPTPERWFGDFAFAFAYSAPFVLSLTMLRIENRPLQAAVWGATGILALLGAFSAFSGITLFFLPAALILLIISVVAFVQALRGASLMSIGLMIGTIAMLVTVGVVSFLTLLLWTSDPRCWILVRDSNGQTSWEIAPSNVASIRVTASSSGQSITGTGRGSDPGIVKSTCTSDTISPHEASVSIGLWMLTALGIVFSQRDHSRVWQTS